jgi:hypothetical protein
MMADRHHFQLGASFFAQRMTRLLRINMPYLHLSMSHVQLIVGERELRDIVMSRTLDIQTSFYSSVRL